MGTTNNFSARTPRKLFSGPFQPALESALAEHIAAHKRAHGALSPVTVVVPTRLLAVHLQRALARSLPNGHVNVRFQTLTDLLPPGHMAPRLGLELLCRQLARDTDLFPADGYFSPVSDTTGFAGAMLETFKDLEQAAITPEAFKKAAGRNTKLKELAAAYAAYRHWLAKHEFVTEADLFLKSQISNPKSPVFLYGFYDLTAVQRTFVERLAPAAVFFPKIEHSTFAQPLLEWFQSLDYAPMPSSVSPQPSSLSVLSCPGELAEVREAIREALAFVKAEGRTFNDVAILCRSREQYDAIARDTFAGLGIKPYFRGGRPISEQPDAHLLLLLLDAIHTDFSRAAVMELACHCGPYSRWDTRSIELGITGGQQQWRARADGELLEFLTTIFQHVGSLPKRGRWADFIEPVLKAWRELGGTHAPVADAVRGLAELDPFEPKVDFETFAGLCRKALDIAREQTEMFQGGGMFVGDVMGARGLSFAFVVVLGLVEKSFPRIIREDPLLLDDERARIDRDLPLKQRSHDEERLLFDLVVGTARDKLVLSFPRLETGSGRPRVPSFLIQSLTTDKPGIVPLTPFARKLEQPVDERELNLMLLAAKTALPRALAADISPHFAAGLEAERHRWGETKLTAFDGLVPGAGLALDTLAVSPTQLETFAFCPFKYFNRHVLGLERWEDPEQLWEAEPAEVGQLAHRILERVYREGAKLDKIAEEELKHFERNKVTGLPVVWAWRRAALLRDLAVFLETEHERAGDGFSPREFEYGFKDVLLEDLQLHLSGRIDRVDKDGTGKRARIVDYKTGKAYHTKDDALEGGETLQLPLYALAAEKKLNVRVVSSEYAYFTARGGYRRVTFSEQALRDRQGELRVILATFAAMLRAGVFAQHTDHGKCAMCDYRPICGNAVESLADRKRGDPRLKEFFEAKEIEWKDDQARKLAANDLRTTYLVEAAAGTGKTTLLVSRILSAIRAGVRLTEMVAITFTEKAAGELKQRLRVELEKEKGPALEDIERAQVSTIHAFCAWLLKERPVEARVDPQFGVADALQAELLLEEAWYEWLPREAAALKIDSNPLRRLLAAGIGVEKLWELAQQFVRDREKVDLTRIGKRARAVPGVLDDIRKRVAQLAELRQSCSSPKPDKLAQAIDEWAPIAPHALTEEFALTAPLLAPAKDGDSFGDKKRWKPDDHFTKARALGAEVEQLRLELMDGLLRETLTWLAGFLARYDELKRERVLLDFDDLLLKTRDLLRRDKVMRAELQRRFRHIFVDEFQDTDPMQTEIVFFLAEDGAKANRWEDCRLAPGKLFIVGDQKQSIYGFRRADIELYRSVAEKLDTLTISTNFRSKSTLLRWVNEVFEKIIEPSYVALEPSEKHLTDAPTVWQLQPTEELKTKSAARPLEADAVARCLFHLHDKDGRKWSDMAILFCTTTALDTFTGALRRYEVPYRVIGGKDFYVRQEILTLASLLCCLDNPEDKLSLVATLRSPLFGWTDEQIFEAWRDARLDYLRGTSPTFALLRDLHAKRHALSVAAFTEAAMNATKICEAFFAKPDGEQNVMNLLKALDLARALEAAGEHTVRAVVRRLRRSVLEGWDEESSPATEEDDDVVRLMTVHKAKGLEFPVIVMADLPGEAQEQNVSILRDAGSENIEARISKMRTLGFAAANARQARRDAAEEVRLLYVAATRAKELLVVPWFVPDKAPGRSAHIAGALKGLANDRMVTRTATDFTATPTEEPPLRFHLLTDTPDDGRIRERQTWQRERGQLLARAAKPLPRVSPSKLAGEAGPVQREDEEVGVERERAMEFGSVVHEALEQMNARVIAESKLSDADKQRGAEMVERVLQSELWARVKKADAAYRELPFTVPTDAGLMEGKIDLLFCEGGKWTLADYKTDARIETERYAAQLRAYEAALKKVAGITLAQKLLFFVANGTVKQVD